MLRFDERGYLVPSGNNSIDQTVFKRLFVDPFPDVSSRHNLFDSYLEYSNSLSELIEGKPFRQWINGSFISQDGNPRDIDLVNLIDYQVVDLYEPQLRKFISKRSKRNLRS